MSTISKCFIWICFVSGISYGGSIVGWGSKESAIMLNNIPLGDNYVSVCGGVTNNVAVTEDGTIVSWGLDGYYQAAPAGSGFKDIDPGLGAASLAIADSGSILAWGDNSYDQISSLPAGNNYAAVAAGSFHCLALTSDGSLVKWGQNYGTWDGTGVLDLPVTDKYKAVSAGGDISLAIKTDGTLVLAGLYMELAEITLMNQKKYVDVKSGLNCFVGLAEDGSLFGWGAMDDTMYSDIPSGNDFIAVDAGIDFLAALRSNGTVVIWGDAACRDIYNVPSDVYFTDIACGSYYIYGVTPEPATLGLLLLGGLTAMRRRKHG